MVGVASDEGIGRRLPQWMLGVSVDNRVQSFQDGDNKQPEEEHASQASQTKETNSIKHPRKSELRKRKEIQLGAPQCESKKRKGRKRKSIQSGPDVPDAVPGIRRKSPDSASPGRYRPGGSEFGSSLVVQGQYNVDDDMELTVGDLMIIAKEYMEADENRARKLTFYGESESSSPNQRTSSIKNQSERSFSSSNPDCKQSSLNCKTSVPHNSPLILDGQQFDLGVRRTGDPAKDMLDLFLGPLLKKSPENEKSEFVLTDVQFSHDLKSQSQRPNDNVEVASVMKKKSSLKDKVAIFLG